MRKRVKKGMRPLLRNVVREGIREGRTNKDIHERIEDRYGEFTVSTIDRMISQETRRQNAVTSLAGIHKNKVVDMRRLTGCTDPGQTIRAYITLHWQDEASERIFDKGVSVLIPPRGRLGEILNNAINDAANFLISKNYPPPTMTHANTSGKKYYRLEYVECVSGPITNW